MNMPKNAKVVSIPLANVIEDFEWNFAREPDVASYDDPIMRQDLAARGQITPAVVLELPEKNEAGEPVYKSLQGNRRRYNIGKLAVAGVEDPTTCKLDDNGDPIRGTGKPFSTLRAVVLKNLTERERREIMSDHGTTRGLNRVELQRQIEGLFDVQMKEKDVARLSAGLLLHHYPPKREIKSFEVDDGADFLNNYKGVIDAAKRRWKSPKPLHDLAMEVLRGKQNWPTKAEIYDGLKIHEAEVAADRTGKIDRETPGPKFNEWFEKLLKAHATVDENGGSKKGKSISAMNRAQMEEFAKACDCRLGKWFIYAVLRDDRVFPDKVAVVAKLAKKAEKGEVWTAEDQAAFDDCWNAATEVVAEEKPKADERPEDLDEDEAASSNVERVDEPRNRVEEILQPEGESTAEVK